MVAVGYYCRFSLRYRDVSGILKERGNLIHPTTIMQWIHEYGNFEENKQKSKTILGNGRNLYKSQIDMALFILRN